MNNYTIFIILFMHWVCDFIFQSQKIAKSKYNDLNVLLTHIGIYTFSMYISSILLLSQSYLNLFNWVALNAFLHFLTDYCTSKITHKLYEEKRYHEFFCVIGADQLIHTSLLLITANYFNIK